MQYVYMRPPVTSFEGDGLFGYTFGPLKNDVDFYYIEVTHGHDTFMISQKIARTYYILSGNGYFTIAGDKYEVGPGMLVEVPPKVEYSYSGQMKIIAFSQPRWFAGNDKITRFNPDVFGAEAPRLAGEEPSRLARLVRSRIFGKSPISRYLRLSQRLWNRLPPSFTEFGPMRRYGNCLHALAKLHDARTQAFSTFFLRNRPQLELVRRLVERSQADSLRVAVLGCSTGAEAYSLAWTIRSARPDLRLIMHAIDISRRAVEVARRGVYSLSSRQVTDSNIFERMTQAEIEEVFDRDGDFVVVKPWIREGIEWQVGDAGGSGVGAALSPQDIVVANNFLCHMPNAAAEKCLHTIACLVRPYGYLLVSGIDVDVRTKVAIDLGWKPVEELLEQIHEGDPCLREFWPCHYGGLEPLDKNRPDWRRRYAAAFQLIPFGLPPDITVLPPQGIDGCEPTDPRHVATPAVVGDPSFLANRVPTR
jgi:chemotaxis methyl-accepting protein methylase